MSAGELYFVDTNILLYAADQANPVKGAVAREHVAQLWQTSSGRVSWQVLHEYYVNAVRKMGIPSSVARETVETLALWRPVDSSIGLVHAAWHCVDDAGLNYWDALVVAAAQRSGCRWLLTEDLQHGRVIGGITVRNPFLGD